MPGCNTCVFCKECPIFHADMTDKEGCPIWSEKLEICDMCGKGIVGMVCWTHEEDKWYKTCGSCTNAAGCATCGHTYCAFQADRSCNEPQMVMREMRQGNMIMQTQIMNPKRVEMTCRKGCPCFNEDGLDSGNFCKKQNGVECSNYKTRWRN